MGTYLLAALVLAAIVYGAIALKILSKRVEFNISQAVEGEISSRIYEAIDYAEEWANDLVKNGKEQIPNGVEKFSRALDRAKAMLPNMSVEELGKKIQAALGEIRREFGMVLMEAGEKIKD